MRTETNRLHSGFLFAGCMTSTLISTFSAGEWREERFEKKDGHQTLGNFKQLQIVLEGESVSRCAAAETNQNQTVARLTEASR